MEAPQYPQYLLRSLGSLPGERKAGFVKDALAILNRFQGKQAAQRPMPPKADRDALARVGSQTARLIQAIKSVGESETASMLLTDSWINLDNASGERMPSPMPILERLQKAAELCLPERKRAPTPLDGSAASTSAMAIVALAEQFREHFGRAPSFAPGSPFVKFIREALPAYGLSVPVLARMRKIVAAG